jgi:hypothetical protein
MNNSENSGRQIVINNRKQEKIDCIKADPDSSKQSVVDQFTQMQIKGANNDSSDEELQNLSRDELSARKNEFAQKNSSNPELSGEGS